MLVMRREGNVRKQLKQPLLLGLICAVFLITACASATGASPVKVDVLVGKRVAGTPSTWNRIGKWKRPVISGTAGPGLFTGTESPNETPDGISFFQFPSTKAATAFFAHPSSGVSGVIGGMPIPLSSPGPASAPSRWIDEESCIYEGTGPNPHHAPKGAPSATPSHGGKCAVGVPMSGGIASMTKRGNVVMIVNPVGYAQPDVAVPSSFSTTQPTSATRDNVTLTASALRLLHQSGVS
jgi:hypothetical protein